MWAAADPGVGQRCIGCAEPATNFRRVPPSLPHLLCAGRAAVASARQCRCCGATHTSKWRCSGTLCNACGLRKGEPKPPVLSEEEKLKLKRERQVRLVHMPRPTHHPANHTAVLAVRPSTLGHTATTSRTGATQGAQMRCAPSAMHSSVTRRRRRSARRRGCWLRRRR